MLLFFFGGGVAFAQVAELQSTVCEVIRLITIPLYFRGLVAFSIAICTGSQFFSTSGEPEPLANSVTWAQ